MIFHDKTVSRCYLLALFNSIKIRFLVSITMSFSLVWKLAMQDKVSSDRICTLRGIPRRVSISMMNNHPSIGAHLMQESPPISERCCRIVGFRNQKDWVLQFMSEMATVDFSRTRPVGVKVTAGKHVVQPAISRDPVFGGHIAQSESHHSRSSGSVASNESLQITKVPSSSVEGGSGLARQGFSGLKYQEVLSIRVAASVALPSSRPKRASASAGQLCALYMAPYIVFTRAEYVTTTGPLVGM